MSTSRLNNGPVFCKPLVEEIRPLRFRLNRHGEVAVAFPVVSLDDVPPSLVEFMHSEFNKEIASGLTYPQAEPLTGAEFTDMWFRSFCAILLQTDDVEHLQHEHDNWDQVFLGTFYVKPNYAARCSHICNAGFLVNHCQRNKRVGFRLAQLYLSWAPLLGYQYSVFNLVFVTNEASWKIWDRFKFDRIGLVPRAGVLKGYPDPVDAIIFGKDLTKVEPELLIQKEEQL